jgi:hypothetical protein
VINSGVVDASPSSTGQVPGFTTSQLEGASKKKAFDQEMTWAERLSKLHRANLHFRAEPFGIVGELNGTSTEVMKGKLGDEVKYITTLVLMTSPEDEQFWPGRSERLFEGCPASSLLVVRLLWNSAETLGAAWVTPATWVLFAWLQESRIADANCSREVGTSPFDSTAS